MGVGGEEAGGVVGEERPLRLLRQLRPNLPLRRLRRLRLEEVEVEVQVGEAVEEGEGWQAFHLLLVPPPLQEEGAGEGAVGAAGPAACLRLQRRPATSITVRMVTKAISTSRVLLRPRQ